MNDSCLLITRSDVVAGEIKAVRDRLAEGLASLSRRPNEIGLWRDFFFNNKLKRRQPPSQAVSASCKALPIMIRGDRVSPGISHDMKGR